MKPTGRLELVRQGVKELETALTLSPEVRREKYGVMGLAMILVRVRALMDTLELDLSELEKLRKDAESI
jgi:hypothetical protein